MVLMSYYGARESNTGSLTFFLKRRVIFMELTIKIKDDTIDGVIVNKI